MRRWLICAVLTAPLLLLAESAPSFKPHQLRWWAIQKIVSPAVPPVQHTELVKNDIDRFLLAKLEAAGLQYNPAADKRTLLRRVTLDLTGLPPSPEELQAFLSDSSANAYEKVVDRLLSSPRYGERWARHWLDVARYADSEGFKADETRPNVWRYRDYVIQSFNADKPYNRFVKEQIAGDELYPGDAQALVATGFNRHFPDESNAANIDNRRQELLNDITDTIGTAFLGITVGCARCHDHKFDPILHRDYYRLQAFFANVRIDDNKLLDSDEKRAEWVRQNTVWEAKTAAVRSEMEKLLGPAREAFYKERLARFPDETQDIIRMKAADRTPYQQQVYIKAATQITFTEADIAARLKGAEKTRYAELAKNLSAFDSFKPADLAVGQVMVDASALAPKTHVLHGGNYLAPAEEVEPGFLSILDAKPAAYAKPDGLDSTGRRAALANWLGSETNPLTPRVVVNRIWDAHFGRGISATPGDFGIMGDRPANRELLDYLASSFIKNGWSLKRLHRDMVTSQAYRQSSDFNEKAAAADPDNKLVWRFQRRRLDGEIVRDAALATAGLLNLKEGGPGVFPPRPSGTATASGWKDSTDPDQANRRSIYIFVRRNSRYPMLESFDMPDTHESCARRQQTVSVTQSLAMLNDTLVLDWAKSMAGRVLNDAGLTPDAQIERSFRLAFGRAPEATEIAPARAFLDRQTQLIAARLAAGSQPVIPVKLPGGIEPARAGALVDFCHVLLNSNEFLYLE